MKIYRIYTEDTEYVPSDVIDVDGYIDEMYDEYKVVETTIKYVDSYGKLSDYIDNCGIREDLYYEEIEVE